MALNVGSFSSACVALSNAATTMNCFDDFIAPPLLGERAGGEGGPLPINHHEKMRPPPRGGAFSKPLRSGGFWHGAWKVPV